MAKDSLYRTFISRMEAASATGNYLESSWYAYAVLEDRLISMLRNSGGAGVGGKGKPIKMMGPKLKELNHRTKTDALLKAYFEHDRLDAWKHERNNLMHAMADASMSLEAIDAAAKTLAEDGSALVRDYLAACRRLKANRDKVSA